MSLDSMSDTLYKLGTAKPQDEPWSFPDLWAREQTSGPERLILAPRSGEIDALLRLVEIVPEPIHLLYVLIVPREPDYQPGRYQSPDPVTREEAKTFLLEFRDFLEQDGRHNLWLRSATSSAMLVFDRHKLIYAYGPLDEFQRIAEGLALTEVPSSSIRLPSPHSHHYHPQFDPDEKRMMSLWSWHQTPLQDQDER
jgi:hypothetical protein